MKDWKEAIEHIGFQRCSYEKQDHIHCMAFRKTVQREDYSSQLDMSTNMYIPQDFNTTLPSDCESEPTVKRQKINDH